ncbi:hypothetical protein N136_02928, partial [Leifsonia aquatica ATCC 14665]
MLPGASSLPFLAADSGLLGVPFRPQRKAPPECIRIPGDSCASSPSPRPRSRASGSRSALQRPP